MPHILDLQVPTEAPTGAPGGDYQHIQTSPEMFGGYGARALGELGTGVEKAGITGLDVATERALFAGKVNVDDQVNQWINRVDTISYGDPTKKTTGPDGKPVADTGYFGLQGRAASDARDATLKALEDARVGGRNNLGSPREKLEYDIQTRRIFGDRARQFGAHAEQQWKQWATSVNGSKSEWAMANYLRNLDDERVMNQYAQSYIAAKLNEAELKFGDDPDIHDRVIADAQQQLLRQRVMFMGAKDPASAQKILDKYKDVAGSDYATLSDHLRSRASEQIQYDAAHRAQVLGAQRVASAGGLVKINAGGKDITVNSAVAPQFKGFIDEIVAAGAPITNIGSYNYRIIDPAHTGGQQVLSQHAFGNAIDINQSARNQVSSEFKAWAESHPQELRNAINRWGITSGGDWHDPDFGHFEIAQRGMSTGQVAAASMGGVQPVGALAPAGGAQPAFAVSGATPALAVPPSVAQVFAGVKSAAFQALDEDTSLSDHDRRGTQLKIVQELQAQEIAAGANEREQKQAGNAAASNYVSAIWDMAHSDKKDWLGLANRINQEPLFANEPHLKEGLLNRLTQASGKDEEITFGPGYVEARARAFTGPNDPAHLSLAELANRDDLTTRGLNDIATRLRLAQRDIDRHSVEQRITNRLQEVKQKLSFEQDVGPIRIRDPKGEQAYHNFVDDFLKGMDAEIAAATESGKRDGIDKYLSREHVDAMVREYRDPRQMMRDRMQAAGEAEPPGTPLPPPRKGVNADAWAGLMTNRPLTPEGKPMPSERWASDINKLLDNPTPEKIKAFNESQYGKWGFNAEEIIAKFGTVPQAGVSTTEATERGAKATKTEQKAVFAPAGATQPEPMTPPHELLRRGAKAVLDALAPEPRRLKHPPSEPVE